MSWKKDVEKALGKLVAALEERNNTILVLKEEIVRLRTQNEKLLDRLMAVDWVKYSTYKETTGLPWGPAASPNEIDLESELLAGEALEIGRDLRTEHEGN